jgi:hypothetical protein
VCRFAFAAQRRTEDDTMNAADSQYSGPLVAVSLTAVHSAEGPSKYRWKVEMSALDHRGQHLLGYKAFGLLSDLNDPPKEFDIVVRDKDRNVWTTMPSGDRKDIRARIKLLVQEATVVTRLNGHA